MGVTDVTVELGMNDGILISPLSEEIDVSPVSDAAKLRSVAHLGKVVRGLRVRIADGSDLGTYIIKKAEPARDGSLLVYGGDADPNGRRGWHSFLPRTLILEDRTKFTKRPARTEEDDE